MARTAKEQSKWFKLSHKIYMAMIQQDCQRPTQDREMRMREMAVEITDRIFDEYCQRRDKGLWLDRLIKSGKLWEM